MDYCVTPGAYCWMSKWIRRLWLRFGEVIGAIPVQTDITDLHVWRVGKGKYACILSLVTADAAEPSYFKQQLGIHEELVHITVEVNARPLPG